MNLESHAFQCFTCDAAGNQLDLWAAAQHLSLFEAARDLCERLGIEVPAVERWWSFLCPRLNREEEPVLEPSSATASNGNLDRSLSRRTLLMYRISSQLAPDGRSLQASFASNDGPLRYRDALALWQENAEFRTTFLSFLQQAPFAAFRWETPPLVEGDARAFEFVLLDSPGLEGSCDSSPFATHFAPGKSGDDVVAFVNLGKDAVLVVPRPLATGSRYGHLADFVRTAPDAQQHALWRAVGKAATARLSKKPVWISTAGYGVSWLHVRLDDRPKYYGHAPYKSAA